ncbi:hypothetical protein [Cellulosimicrobium marinum]|uniref:hypothetical protein n=1 Tax=Cellulosimicrobium marinum TaxID=1638992 RepID=UPI001E4E693B|nr:hypothetical protein [Cellulosimicrobium marinum]MCB7136890.1 hypothetical protein [Cellulosimicrobium marinum]
MTRTTTARAARTSRFWAVPVVVASVAVAAACSPIETDRPYSPSDGLRVDLADGVRGLNLMVVTAAEGDPGTLIGAFANDSSQDVEFEVTPEGGAGLTVPVASGETVYLGTEDGFDAQLGQVDAAPGAVLPVTVAVSTGEEQSLSLPVFDGTLEEYAHLVP